MAYFLEPPVYFSKNGRNFGFALRAVLKHRPTLRYGLKHIHAVKTTVCYWLKSLNWCLVKGSKLKTIFFSETIKLSLVVVVLKNTSVTDANYN